MLNRRDNPPKMYPFLPDADKGPIKGFLDLRAVVAGPPPMDGTGHTVPGFMGYHSWLKTVSAGASSVDYLFQFLINDGYRMELREVSVTVARDLGIGRFTGSVAGGSRIDLIMDSSNMTMESVALSDGACEMEPGCVVWVSDALRSVTFMVSNMDRVASDRYIVAAFQGPNTVALSSKDGYGFSLGGGVLGMSVKSPTVTAALPTPTPSPTGVYDGLLTLGGVGPDATGNIPVEALAPVTVTSPARGVLVIGRATPAGTVEPTQNTNPVWRVPRKKRVMTPDEAGYYGYNCVKVSKLILDPPDCYNNKILQIPTLFGTSGVPVGGPGTLPLTTGSGSWVYGMVFPSVWPPPQAYPHTCDGYHHMNVLIPDYPFVTPRGAEFGEGAYPMCFDLKRQCDGPESDYCGYWKILDYVKQTEVWVPLRVDTPWDKSAELVPSAIIKKSRYGIPDYFDGYIQFHYCPPRELNVCFEIFENDTGQQYLGYYDSTMRPVTERAKTPTVLYPKRVHSDFVDVNKYYPQATRICAVTPGGGGQPIGTNGFYVTFHACTPLPLIKPPEIFPVKITGKAGPFHTIEMYENGYGFPPTGSGTMFVMGLNLVDSLPVGTWTLGARSAMAVTGGGSA